MSMGIYSHINMSKGCVVINRFLPIEPQGVVIKTTFLLLCTFASWSGKKKLCLKFRLVFGESHLSGLLTFSHSAIKKVSSIKIHNA